MGRWWVAGGMLLALGATACGGSDGGGLDVGALESKLVEDGAVMLEGAVVGEATCPDDVDVEVGESFECTLVVDRQEAPFTVTRNDGAYDFVPAARVVAEPVSNLEEAGAAFVLQNEGVDVGVDCGGDAERRWLIVSEVTTVECEADYGDVARTLAMVLRRNAEIRDIKWVDAKLDYGVVSDRVNQQLVGRLRGGFYLSCPETFPDESATVALEPGTVFRCTAVRDLVEIAQIEVKVRDVNGKVAATIAPQ